MTVSRSQRFSTFQDWSKRSFVGQTGSMYVAILLFVLTLGTVMLIVVANAFKRDGVPTFTSSRRRFARKKVGEARITFEEIEHRPNRP